MADSIKKTSYGRFMLSPNSLRTMADNLEKRTGKKADDNIEVSLYRVDAVEDGKTFKTIGVMPVEEIMKVIKTKKEAKKAIKEIIKKEIPVDVETAEVIEEKRLKDLKRRKLRRHKAKVYTDLQKKQKPSYLI